jgi:predicted nucleotidyltransferase
LRFFFDTPPGWIEALQNWAASDPRVAEVWVFGSRAKGQRTPKDAPDPVPDLDVGYTLTGEDQGERLAYAICEVGRARKRLQALMSVRLDLQYAEPETDARVWPAILDHGIKIYSKEPLD